MDNPEKLATQVKQDETLRLRNISLKWTFYSVNIQFDISDDK